MHARPWMKLTLFVLLFAALPAVAAQPIYHPPLDDAPLSGDIMPATSGPVAPAAAGAVYEVTPILFVPADVTPVPNGLDYVDRHMINVQYWYSEILNGRTFTLRPAELVVGYYPRTHYFGDCYPPVNPSECSWGYAMWESIFNELNARGYDVPAYIIQGVFFQGEGMGTALGGGRRFLVGFQPDTLFPDCLGPGCAHNVNLGGAAHELGHALGLPHPDGDPLWGISLMGTGFYSFPQCTFINSSQNAEYDKLLASPFINLNWPLANPGFESCLAGWSVLEGSPACEENNPFSGLKALKLDSNGRTRLSRALSAMSATTYDFSGWVRIDALPPGGEIKIQLKALDANLSSLQLFTLAQLEQPTQGWTRIGMTITLPEYSSKGTLFITTQGAGIEAWLDNLNLAGSKSPPPVPLIAGGFDGDAVATARPVLRWSPVASAAWFDVEIAANPFFDSVLASESGITGYEFESPVTLPYGQYSYWRVRAVNGAGTGEWSPVWSVNPRKPAAFYNEEFEEGALGKAWSFVREDPGRWHLGGVPGRRWQGYFTVDMQPGDLESANDARNLLLRPMPDGDFAVETLAYFFVPLNANYQQGGLLIYKDDDNYIRLGHVYRDGWRIEFEAEIDGVVQRAGAWLVDETRLRIERRGDTYTAAYSPSGVGWTPLGEPVTVEWSGAKMGLAAYGGQPSDQMPTAAFNWFRVAKPCHAVAATATPELGGTLSVAGASCDTGLYRPNSPLRLVALPARGYLFDYWSGGASGSENPVDVSVSGPLQVVAHFKNDPALDAYESNDTFATATPVELGNALWAAIDDHDDVEFYDDVDFFRFAAGAGTRVRVEISGDSNLSPDLCLYDSAQSQLLCRLSKPDNTNTLDYAITQAGDYFLKVSASCGEGGLGCQGTYRIRFRLSDIHEPNDTAESATPIAYGDQIDGDINAHDDVDEYGDKDYFVFAGKAGDPARVTLALPAGNDLAPFVCLLDVAEAVIECDEQAPDGVNISYVLPATGAYFVRVEGICYEGGMGCNGPYELTLSMDNRPPTAVDDAYQAYVNGTLALDAAEGLLANDSDPDGDALAAEIIDLPLHGTMALKADGSFTYTPAAGFAGEDSFTYRAGDGTAVSEPATVLLTITGHTTYLPVAIR